MDIQDERTWVFRNGLIWDGVIIRPGDNYWVEGGSLDQPRHARLCLRDRPIVWWKNDPIRTERMPLFHAIHELNDLRWTYRRGEIEVRRNGMLWREELVTEGSRWEIKKIEEYDPERLEAEGHILPLPPPLLGVKHYMWKNAPRTVPVNQDPLKWLGLKPRDWQVSGNQIVPKGVGGYDPDSEEPGDTTDWDARCPDFPSHGSIEIWEYFKRLMNLERQEKHNITWKEAEVDIALITRSEGWETALTLYLMATQKNCRNGFYWERRYHHPRKKYSINV
jgi:hypothetical protein